jgi:hypothetical protein
MSLYLRIKDVRYHLPLRQTNTDISDFFAEPLYAVRSIFGAPELALHERRNASLPHELLCVLIKIF